MEGLRFHDLRHTAGTLSAQTGATTKEIMARLGHARARAAMVYQHATEDRDRLIAERLTAMAQQAGLATVTSLRPVENGHGRADKGIRRCAKRCYFPAFGARRCESPSM